MAIIHSYPFKRLSRNSNEFLLRSALFVNLGSNRYEIKPRPISEILPIWYIHLSLHWQAQDDKN